MKTYLAILGALLFILGGIIIFGVIFSNVSVVKCSPKFNLDGSYVGMNCGGEF